MTCHNSWIVVRLVGGGSDHPFLAISPLITVEDSSVPFRAFLGAILSDLKGVVVEASEFDDNQILEPIDKGEEEGPPPVSDSDDDSGEYRGRSGQGPVGSGPMTLPRPRYRYDLPVHLSLNEPSEIHLNRFRHLHHTLPKHFEFGYIFVLSRTTSSNFPHFPTMANVFG